MLIASQQAHRDCVRKLLDAGADVTIRNLYGLTAAKVAVKFGNATILKDLLSTGKVDINGDRVPLLILAARHGHHECVRVLLDAGADKKTATDSTGLSAMDIARAEGHFDIVELLSDTPYKESAELLTKKSPCFGPSIDDDVVEEKLLATWPLDPQRAREIEQIEKRKMKKKVRRRRKSTLRPLLNLSMAMFVSSRKKSWDDDDDDDIVLQHSSMNPEWIEKCYSPTSPSA